nr:translation initiation factor eIF-2B subunit epsilon [Onthophagus taurus]
MSSKKNTDVFQRNDLIQAVVIANTFGHEFLPISNNIPLALFSVANKPLIASTLEFLALGGVEEVFLFCTAHVELIKDYIRGKENANTIWCLSLKIHVIVSESCVSFGDCMRDLDAKGLLRGYFVLCEAGVISNINLLPIMQKHKETCQKDKGAVMTLIYEESTTGQYGRCPTEEIVVASNLQNRILFHKKIGLTKTKRIDIPLEIFLENNCLSINHNLKDTRIAICSQEVLPLFSDNFDFQTRDDFIKGLLLNEEIMGSTIYWHPLKGNEHGGAITNWRMYQATCREMMNNWYCPITADVTPCYSIEREVLIGKNCSISKTSTITNSIIGNNCKIGDNVKIENAFTMDNVEIYDNSTINHSVIGPNCVINENCVITIGSVLGGGVVLPKDSFVENSLIQATKPEEEEEHGDLVSKLGEKAFRIPFIDDVEDPDVLGTRLAVKFSKMHLCDEVEKSDEDYLDSSSDSEGSLSHIHSPVPDDTSMFFNEVMDSLSRGFEDKLPCDNLILEINSSRYAYNVTLKEVNYFVVKAILNLPFHYMNKSSYLLALRSSFLYFSPILKNYIRNHSAMEDCLQAIEDMASSNNEISDSITNILNFLYDKDYLEEEIIIVWSKKLEKGTRLSEKVAPFIDWLHEAEETSSSDESE